MSITVKEYRHGSATKTSDGYTAEREIIVITTGEPFEDLELRVLDLSEVPEIGDALSNDYPTVLCTDISSEETVDDNYSVWTVTLKYETPSDDDEDSTVDDPLDEPVTVSGSDLRRSTVLELAYSSIGDTTEVSDKKEVYVANSIGQPFDPPIMEDDVSAVISITKNFSSYDYSLIAEYTNTVNKAKERCGGVSIEAGQGLIKAIRPTSGTQNGISYESVTFEIAINLNGWSTTVPNNGTTMLDRDVSTSTDLVFKPITYADIGVTGSTKDEFVDQPQLLTYDGDVITSKTAEPVLLVFNTKQHKSWNSLQIPSSKG